MYQEEPLQWGKGAEAPPGEPGGQAEEESGGCSEQEERQAGVAGPAKQPPSALGPLGVGEALGLLQTWGEGEEGGLLPLTLLSATLTHPSPPLPSSSFLSSQMGSLSPTTSPGLPAS